MKICPSNGIFYYLKVIQGVPRGPFSTFSAFQILRLFDLLTGIVNCSSMPLLDALQWARPENMQPIYYESRPSK